MQNSHQLLRYLHQGIDELLEQGGFDNGFDFRPTQKEALEAYKRFLHSNSLSDEEKLKGFFEIPTGVGKTAVFVGIVAAAHKAAQEDGEELKTVIVVPTTQLLTQTEEALKKFSPQLAGQIGLYGDGEKNLQLPITVMTYEAWFDLSASGRIGSHNTDILISDEAHRGTSERRVDQMLDVFDARTIQLAFTATAHFDADKSVENSHKREIYYKPMREAVQGGELSSYIQSQRAIIRVSPTKRMLTKDFSEAAEGTQIKYRRRLKQKTWNEFALKTFREGRDERTRDLLSDNDAGFFVDGTLQADELEEMLNNDPVLQERAEAQGKKGVAIAIHTNGMNKSEQKERFKAYLRGEYMAVIGDGKFKEGFDHAPMKTIFDYHRNSVVDKVQILGRGARKWWNELKERLEGLTVIDTVIYIGDKDPDINEMARNTALRSSVSVKDVLEEAAVIGPDAIDFGERRTGGGGYGTGPDIFDDNPDIEYVTDLDNIYQLDTDVTKLRKEHLVPISNEDRKKLELEFQRTGIGGMGVHARIENPPEDMSKHIAHQIVVGVHEIADPEHVKVIIETYATLPNNELGPIHKEDKDLMLAEMTRTAVGPQALLKAMGTPPEGLSVAMTHSIINGKFHTARPGHVKAIIEAYSKVPNNEMITISSEDLDTILSETKRVGFGGHTLFNNMKEPSKELDGVFIDGIIRGIRKLATSAQIREIIDAFKEQPNASLHPISDNDALKVKQEKKRTGLGGTGIFKKMASPPAGLTTSIANNIVEGVQRKAKPAYVSAILEAYSIQKEFKLKPIKPEDARKMKLEESRTGLSGTMLLNTMNEVPEGLSKKAATKIVKGEYKSANPIFVTAIMNAYEKTPNAKPKLLLKNNGLS